MSFHQFVLNKEVKKFSEATHEVGIPLEVVESLLLDALNNDLNEANFLPKFMQRAAGVGGKLLGYGAGKAAGYAADKFNQAKNAVGDAASRAGTAVGNYGTGLKNQVGSMAQNAANKLGQAKDAVGNYVGDKVDKAKQFGGKVVDKIQQFDRERTHNLYQNAGEKYIEPTVSKISQYEQGMSDVIAKALEEFQLGKTKHALGNVDPIINSLKQVQGLISKHSSELKGMLGNLGQLSQQIQPAAGPYKIGQGYPQQSQSGSGQIQNRA